MTPIPDHLRAYSWYAPHLAYLVSIGVPVLHDPGDAKPQRANLARANLARANLARADLARANLARANLAGANLARAGIEGADLARADLAGANLARADLAGANLARADLARADLARADLARANLVGARGIASAGPVGAEARTIYAVAHEGGPMIQAGCSWRNVADTIAAIRERYADGTGREHLRAGYIEAVWRIAAQVGGTK